MLFLDTLRIVSQRILASTKHSRLIIAHGHAPVALVGLVVFCCITAACAPHARDPFLQPAASPQPPPSCVRSSCVAPLRLRDATRVAYVLSSKTGHLERGVIEAGSWMEFAMLQVANRTLHATLFEGDPHIQPGAYLGESLVTRISASWTGRDRTPWTADDRPFHSLFDLKRRAKLDALDLGRLVGLVRHTPDIFPQNPDVWTAISGHAFSPVEARSILHTINSCDAKTLKTSTRLRSETIRAVHQKRPVQSLTDLQNLPWVNRDSLVRLAHHSAHLPCAHPSPPEARAFAFWLHRTAQSSPEFAALASLFTDAHASQLFDHFTQHLDTWVHTQNQHPIRLSQALALATRDQAKTWVQSIHQDPFQLIPKPTLCNTPHDDFALRECATEHILHHLVHTAHSPPYHTRIQHDTRTLVRDLTALKHRDPSWVVYEHGSLWTARGNVWNHRTEININLNTGSVETLEMTSPRTQGLSSWGEVSNPAPRTPFEAEANLSRVRR